MSVPTKKMPSTMQQGHSFARVPEGPSERSVFDRSHGYKSTFDAGYLIPIFVDYAVPGDTFSCRMTAFARLTTPIKPLMDNMYLESFFFFVPFRLIWTNFVKMMGEQDTPGASIAYTVPQSTIAAPGHNIATIADYMGLPTNGTPAITATLSYSALPTRAYALIYNQWFRDQNLIATYTTGWNTGDGPDTFPGQAVPFKRGKRHDYFTSCLTALQKGVASAVAVAPASAALPPTFRNTSSTVTDARLLAATTADIPGVNVNSPVGSWTGGDLLFWDQPNLTVLINDLRLALATQMFLEKDARAGTRYTELVYSHFKVRSDDARLQRSEYLGGGSTPVTITPIAQQTQTGLTGGNTPIGNLSGVGAALASGHGFHKSFTEHGVVIGIVNVRTDLTYSQGIERFWSYSTRFDFPWPVFAHLGEQAVLNREIYATGAAADALVFGYQPRYEECRYKPSKVTGLFRPTAAGSLELWHLSEKFSALPTLGQTFIEDQTESILDTRVAVPTEPDFYLDAWFEYKCARPLPVFGVPGLGGRF